MNWAKEEIALLKSLREQRIETKVIAERLGRSTFAISKKIYYLGLETRANRGRKRLHQWTDTSVDFDVYLECGACGELFKPAAKKLTKCPICHILWETKHL